MENSASLLDQLHNILDNLDKESSVLNLQYLLTTSPDLAALFSNSSSRDLMVLITDQLRRSVLASNLYNTIKACCNQADSKYEIYNRVKSLHNLEGQFMWLGSGCESTFKQSESNLKTKSLFEIMSEESLMRLYMKHGRYLMHRNRPTIVTYQLYNDRKVYLTSRCTPVVIDASSKEFGIMVETRLSKHTKVKEIKKEKTVNQRLKDPETPQLSVPDFNFLSPISSEYKFIPDTEKKLTPSPKVSNSNYANKPTTYSETDKSQDYSEVESISITPYLNAESPLGLKRKRNSRIFISAFK